MLNRRSALVLISLSMLGGATTSAHAQSNYPAKSMRLVVPFPAGDGTDAVARMVSQKLSEALGQPLVVENRAGAGTTIGLAEVARAVPYGYTLGVASAKRSVLAPDIPTISEAGLRGFESGFWYHIVVPRGTARPVSERLRAEIDRIIASPVVRDSMAKSGFESLTLSHEESERALREDAARWIRVIRDNNIHGA